MRLRDAMDPWECRRLRGWVGVEATYERVPGGRVLRGLPLDLADVVELATADVVAYDPDLLLPDDGDLVLRAWALAPYDLHCLVGQLVAIVSGAPRPSCWTDPVPGSTLPPDGWDPDDWTAATVRAEQERRAQARQLTALADDRHRARAVVEDWRAGRWRHRIGTPT